MCVGVRVCLLEGLSLVEALLDVVMVGGGGVDVSDAAVARLHPAVLLKGLEHNTGGGEELIPRTHSSTQGEGRSLFPRTHSSTQD